MTVGISAINLDEEKLRKQDRFAYMSEYLFSYGTLQKKKVQMEVFGRKLHGSTDILKGHKTVTIEIKDDPFRKRKIKINS